MKRFQKSASPFVGNANKDVYFIINSIIIIICISGEGAWHPLQENEVIFNSFNF